MSGLAQSIISRIQGVFNGSPSTRIDDVFSPGASQLSLPPRHRRTFDKIVKMMDEVCKACQSPRLNLKNSPPFILDILPETYQLLCQIFTNDPDLLKENQYIQVFIENLSWKCKAVLKLFRTSAVYDDQSPERRNLTKYSLIFSHMLSELKAEFPNGTFIGSKFRITKKEAADFWKESFKDRTLVTWTDFQNELEKKEKNITRLETLALRDTVDLTGNDHVSNFEFDVFTRLFYPWKSLLRNWQLLTAAHPGYVAFLTYDEVKRQLERLHNKPGSYVFRLSCTRLGLWAIGYVAPDGKIYQTIPQNKSLIQALIEGSKEGFYKYPNGQPKDIDLSSSLEPIPADRIKVTPDQYEIYCEMGTTFELCKICDDNNKNIKLEPCGHLLCQPCLTSWQDSSEGGNTCPFCRYEIKGTSKVIIESFAPIRSSEVRKEKRTPSAPSCASVQSTNGSPSKTTVVQRRFSLNKPRAPDPPRPIPSMGIRSKMKRASLSSENIHRIYRVKDSSPFPVSTAPPLPPRKGSPDIRLASQREVDDLPVAPPPPIYPRQSQKHHSDNVIYVNISPEGVLSEASPSYANTNLMGGRQAS